MQSYLLKTVASNGSFIHWGALSQSGAPLEKCHTVSIKLFCTSVIQTWRPGIFVPTTAFVVLLYTVLSHSHTSIWSALCRSELCTEHLYTDPQIHHLTSLSVYFSFLLLVGPYLDTFDIGTVWTFETIYIIGNITYLFQESKGNVIKHLL